MIPVGSDALPDPIATIVPPKTEEPKEVSLPQPKADEPLEDLDLSAIAPGQLQQDPAPATPAPAPDLPEHPSVKYGKDLVTEPDEDEVDMELQAAAAEVAKKLAASDAGESSDDADDTEDAPEEDAAFQPEPGDSEAKDIEDDSKPDSKSGTPEKSSDAASKEVKEDEDPTTGEIPLLKHRMLHKKADDSSSDTITIDSDGTFHIRS